MPTREHPTVILLPRRAGCSEGVADVAHAYFSANRSVGCKPAADTVTTLAAEGRRTDVMMVLRACLLWNTRPELRMGEFYSSVLWGFANIFLDVMHFRRCTDIEPTALTAEINQDDIHPWTGGATEPHVKFQFTLGGP